MEQDTLIIFLKLHRDLSLTFCSAVAYFLFSERIFAYCIIFGTVVSPPPMSKYFLLELA